MRRSSPARSQLTLSPLRFLDAGEPPLSHLRRVEIPTALVVAGPPFLTLVTSSVIVFFPRQNPAVSRFAPFDNEAFLARFIYIFLLLRFFFGEL